jgi:hypothetical protein
MGPSEAAQLGTGPLRLKVFLAEHPPNYQPASPASTRRRFLTASARTCRDVTAAVARCPFRTTPKRIHELSIQRKGAEHDLGRNIQTTTRKNLTPQKQEHNMFLPHPGDSFELVPSGTFAGVCTRIVDLGTQKSNYMCVEKSARKVMVTWELPEERKKDGTPFTVSKRWTWSTHPKARMRQDLEGWRGIPFIDRDFDPANPSRFNIRNILGKACLLGMHTENGGQTYANVTTVAKLPRGMEATPAKGELIYLFLEEAAWDPDVFHRLSEGLRTTIAKSPEYAARMKDRPGDLWDPPPDDPGFAGRDDRSGDLDIPF